MKLKIKKFDMSWIDDDKVVVLIGKRDTGKSYLTRDLLWHHRDIPIGTVISGSEGSNKFYGNMVPSMFIHEEYNSNIVANVLKRQKLIIKKCHKEPHKRIDPRAFLVLDDCLYDAVSWAKDPNVRYMFMNGRHVKLLFVVTMQYPLGIPPNLRTNIDYVFILRENITANRRRIYENFAGMFPTFDTFCQVLDQVTENYGALVIHNNSKSNRLEDQIFWYTGLGHENFRIGAPEFWRLQAESEANRDDTDDDDDLYDMQQFQKKKKGPIINVSKRHY